jgi:diaminopimelate decarboxylase
MDVKAPVAMRVNPDVDAGTHAKITTGKKENKFGIPLEDALQVYAQAGAMSHIQVQGVSMHIGSQLTQLEPFRNAFMAAKQFVQQLRDAGHTITVLDIGGGLGVPYEKAGETPPSPDDYGVLLREVLGDLACELLCEPGRLITGNAGLLVAEVMYVKHSAGKRFLILDAAMNDLMRPALYDAQHELVMLRSNHSSDMVPYDVVGPVCETGDVFGKNILLPDDLQRGDRVAFRTAGAYGATMSHTYNTRPLIAEVLADGARYSVIRPRQTYEQLLGLDAVPEWLS